MEIMWKCSPKMLLLLLLRQDCLRNALSKILEMHGHHMPSQPGIWFDQNCMTETLYYMML